MPTRGLIVDYEEAKRKGIDYARADADAQALFETRPLVQQMVDVRFFLIDRDHKLKLAGEAVDEATLTAIRTVIDAMSAKLRHLEKIHRRSEGKNTKARKKQNAARKKLVDKLREIPAHVPVEGDAPINKWSRDIAGFLQNYDRKEAALESDPAAGATNQELVENGFRYLNNLMEDDFRDAKQLGVSHEQIVRMYNSAHTMQARLDAEERVKKIANDPLSPLQKDTADMLLASLDAQKRKAVVITPNDILGRKGN